MEHTCPPDMEWSKTCLIPFKVKAGGSRLGYLRGAPCGDGHLPDRAELVACAFVQGHKPGEWTGEEVKEEEVAVTEHHNLHSDCLSPPGGADMISSPRQGTEAQGGQASGPVLQCV